MDATVQTQTIGATQVQDTQAGLNLLASLEGGEGAPDFAELLKDETASGLPMLSALLLPTLLPAQNSATVAMPQNSAQQAPDQAQSLVAQALPQDGLAICLQADGEILPALATASAGANSHTNISQPAAEVQNQGQTLPAAGQGTRRQNLGQPLAVENFPQGWESLLAGQASLQAGSAKPALPKAAQAVNTLPADTSQTIQIPEAGLMPKNLRDVFSKTLGGVSLADSRPNQAKAGADKVSGTEIRPGEHGSVKLAPDANTAQNQSLPFDLTHMSGSVRELGSAALPVAKSTASIAGELLAKMTGEQQQSTLREFARSMTQGLQGNERQLTVELHPPELGRIKVVVEAQGERVNARLTMQDQAVGNFFQDRLDTVRKNLEDAGIRLGQLSVEINQNFNLKEKEETPARQGFGSFGRSQSGTGGGNSKVQAARSMRRAHSGTVDVLI